MTFVRITKNVDGDVKKKLGFEVAAKMSFLMGVTYPMPDWYPTLSALKKTLWNLYCCLDDLFTFLLFMSNVLEIIVNHHDFRAVITCTGTITYIICLRIKLYIFKTKSKTLENVIDSIHGITENLVRNPVKDDGFFEIYHKYFKHMIFFARGKLGSVFGGVWALAFYEMLNGFLQDSREERKLPMYGWYPYDSFDLTNFELTCWFQLISYSVFLLKDIVVDLLVLMILVTLNTHLIYLRWLLGYITDFDRLPDGELSRDKMDLLAWWIKHHQMVLKTIEDFKEITSPYLFYTYISVGIILFFGGVLVTSDLEYDPVQQLIVLSINSSNLLQLYIFSIVGDKITENGLRLTEHGLNMYIITNTKRVRNAFLYIVTKCSKPILIHFGQINPLCVASFAQIVKVTFSYFITIIQIREKSQDSDKLFLNSTEA